MISVRKARLTDRIAITQFIGEAFGPLARYKVRERWLWQFVSNPFRTGSDDEVWVWIAEFDGKVCRPNGRATGGQATRPFR
jgi:hypothetical protein